MLDTVRMMTHQLEYDKEMNQVVIPSSYIDKESGEVRISPQLLRDILPKPLSIEEKIEEMQQMIHEIKKEKLVNIREFIKELNRLAEGERKARESLINCDQEDVKRYTEVARTWTSEKGIIRETRFAIRLIEEEEKYVRELIAKTEAGIE